MDSPKVNGVKRHRCEGKESAFEGPEKLLEVWFSGPRDASLRSIPREKWQICLDLVKCKIVDWASNDYFDAYVLSESSMFVYPKRVILKTCGTTTLLNCIHEVLQLATSCGMTHVEDFFYSRQNFFFPDYQLSPHKTFTDEVTFLDKIFDRGVAFVLGRLNGDSHYNIYNAEHDEGLSAVCNLTEEPPEYQAQSRTQQEDFTLEIMMTGLDMEKMKQFYYSDENSDPTKIAEKSGMASLFPGAMISGFLFKPCGYSMNALLDDTYFTIHVTPEEKNSYASFETNVMVEGAAFRELICRVLQIFNPQQFMLVCWSNRPDPESPSTETDFRRQAIPGFICEDQVMYHFQRYKVNFSNFKTPHFLEREEQFRNKVPRAAQTR